MTSNVSDLVNVWHREDNEYSNLLYTLRKEVTRRGKDIAVNDVTVCIERANGSQTDIGPITDTILAALTPAEQCFSVKDGYNVTAFQWTQHDDEGGLGSERVKLSEALHIRSADDVRREALEKAAREAETDNHFETAENIRALIDTPHPKGGDDA